MTAALLSLLAPATAQGAEGDVATTTWVGAQTTGLQYGGRVSLFVRVNTADSIPMDGYVRFSMDGVEQGRVKLQKFPTDSQASIQADWPLGSTPTITAEFLGSPGFEPSQATKTFTGPTAYTGGPATGSVTFGNEASAIEPSVPFFRSAFGSDPVSGEIIAWTNSTPHTFEAVVAGVGPVAVSVRPFGDLRATVEPDGSASGTFNLTWHPFRVTVGGESWAALCPTAAFSYALSGQSTGDRLVLSGESPPAPDYPSTTCDGRADLVNAVLADPSTMTLDIEGDFAPPPAPDTATTTVVDVTPNTVDGQTSLEVRATVTAASGAAPSGRATFTASGGYSTFSNVTPTGTPLESEATAVFYGPFPDGPVEVAAAFAGTAPTPFLESAGALTVDRAPGRTGLPVSGELTMGANTTVEFPAGSILEGATFNPATGQISGAQLWTPRASTGVDTGFIGTVQALFELSQDAPAQGLVAPDGSVTLGPLSVTLNTPAYRQDPAQSGSSLGTCTKTLSLTLTGTADEAGLHLAASGPLPAFAPGSCGGLGGFIDPALGTTYDLALEVAGDYRLGVEETAVSVGSWFTQVSQQNHALFSANVSSATPATGEVTFYDGITELGSAPIDGGGTALLAAPLDYIGTRSITARYSGDATHQGNQAATTIDVIPTPQGLPMDGTLQVGSVSVPIGEGSVLEPQSPTEGARLWLAPATVGLTVPGYGPLTAEVRLVQNGNLSNAVVGPDGRFNGLSGWFALHVREVTTADGTTVTPVGCAAVVILILGGQVLPAASPVTTEVGGSGAYRNEYCTGASRAVTDALTGRPVELSALVAT